MQMSDIIFLSAFKTDVEPLLSKLGFIRYSLPKGWIQPTFLYKYFDDSIWFESSWDWKDNYIEAEIGGLFPLQDVLPRVIVCGFQLINQPTPNHSSTSTSNFIHENLRNVKKELSALADHNFDKYYRDLATAQTEKKRRLEKYLGNEIITETEIPLNRYD